VQGALEAERYCCIAQTRQFPYEWRQSGKTSGYNSDRDLHVRPQEWGR
jgi:hypothetical protein